MFDVNQFLSGSTDAPMATRPEKPKEGTYLARVSQVENPDEVGTKWIQPPEGNRTWIKLSIPFDVYDPTLLESMGRKQPIKVWSDWRLDIDENSGGAATGAGKNIDLGRLRAALGQNSPGVPWTFNQLFGAGPVKVKIVHQTNKQNPDDPFVKIVRVEPAV